MLYTLTAAAKAAGVAKSTLSKATKSGDLSVAERSGNTVKIDPAELDRWMKATGKTYPNVQSEQTETPENTAALEIEKKALERENALLREQLDDMKGQRDSWQEQAERNTRLLENHEATPAPAPKGIMARLFGSSDKAA